MPQDTNNSSKRYLTFEDLMAIHRISQPAVSPNGRFAAYTTTKHDHVENTVTSTIRLFDLETGEERILTPGPGKHSSPVWSPCGGYLAFVSSRDEKEGSQLWLLPFREGGEARRLSTGDGGVSQLVWSPDGTRIAFARSVIVAPGFNEKEFKKKNKDRKPELADIYDLVNPKAKARVEDSLLFRHWDHWRDRKRNHVFVLDLASGEVEDVTPGDVDSPPISLGSAQDIAFSPDGYYLAVVFNPDTMVARSTNNSVYEIPLDGIRAAGDPELISLGEGCDCNPLYSPGGENLLYLTMDRPGYEADKHKIAIYNRESGDTEILAPDFDRSANSPVFSEGGEFVYFLAQDMMRVSLYQVALEDGRVVQLTQGTNNTSFKLIPGSEDILVTRESTTEAPDLYLLKPGGIPPYLTSASIDMSVPEDAGSTVERLTDHGWLPAEVDMDPVEEFWYTGAGGTPVHGAIIRPPFFDPEKKYPMLFIVHGGPQGMFADSFHFRWNFQLFASEGYVVVLTNPRGSTGYGQEFTDGITRDWGGKCFIDLLNGLDHVLSRYDFIDEKRIGAAGASFGGFMMNWFEGRTDRFKCLVSHDGIFQAETMAYTTEELWFDEWEHGSLPASQEEMNKFSPHLAAENFKTPMLLIHGEMDFRCPISEGLGMFTALQVMGVPSKILFFPEEGHWVLQPANSQVWYRTIQDWFAEWLK